MTNADDSANPPIELNFILVRKGPDGQPYTATREDGTVFEQPLIELLHSNMPAGTNLRFSFWDVDQSNLMPLYSAPVSDRDQEQFMRESHARMQEFSGAGRIQRLHDQRVALERQRQLEAQVRSLGAVPVTAND